MIISTILLLYKLSLHGFPARFRSEFEDEMVEVFRELLVERARQGIWEVFLVGLREFYQMPFALLRSHLSEWRKKQYHAWLLHLRLAHWTPFRTAPIANDGRFSWWQTLLEINLFVITGIFLIIIVYHRPGWVPTGWQHHWPGMGWLVVLLSLPGLLWGLARGLPRWTYPLGGLVLGYSLLVAQRHGLIHFWISTLLASFFLGITAVFINAYSQPLPLSLQRIGRSLALDWTRLSFGFYGVTPFLIITAFDDSYLDDQTPYFALSVLLMILGALLYSRSRRQDRQFAALAGGVTLMLGPALLHQAYFQGSWLASPNLWLADASWMSALWAFMIILLLLPMLASLAHQALTVDGTI